MRSPLPSLAFALTLALPALAPGAYRDSNEAVSPATRMNGGGCYPQSLHGPITEMLELINPEWAAIDVGSHMPPDSDPVTMHATVVFAKINEGGDFPANHATDDQNTLLVLDPAEMAFIATGNVGPHGEEAGNLEFELEIGSYPLFAWAGAGDRMTTVGRWIWDCGHPDPDPLGTCSTTMSQQCITDADCAAPSCPTCLPGETCVGVNFSYHSELHPPQAIAVHRNNGGFPFSPRRRGGRRAVRTDVWITPDSGGAGDRCVVTHRASSIQQLSINCFPLSQPLADVNAADFAFDIPLPPRPPHTTRPPRVRVFDQTPGGLPVPAVTTAFVDGASPSIHVVVDMTTPVGGQLPSQVGKTIVAGWRHDRTPMRRFRVQVTGIEILNALKPVMPVVSERKRCSGPSAQDCSATPCAPGESCVTWGGDIEGWDVFLEANGDWRTLGGLEGVNAPVTVPQAILYDLALPSGEPLRLHASGHSLDCRETMYNMSLSRDLQIFGFTDGVNCLLAESHDVGDLDLALGDVDLPARKQTRTYVTQSVGGAGGACSSTTSQLCLTDADCPSGETCVVTGGSLKLHYTITRRR